MKDNFSPKPVEIQLPNKIYSSNKFWRYNTSKRCKITFINIQKQGKVLPNYNSFLSIFSYINSEEYIHYGTFLLEEIKIKKLEKIKINNELKEFINKIEEDVSSFINNKIKESDLSNRYLQQENINKYSDEFGYDYRDYYFPDDIDYFNYFNKMCIWKILIEESNENWIDILDEYFININKIKNSKLDYKDKTILLITLVRRLLEGNGQKISGLFPRIIFFDEINYENEIDCCCEEAYNLHMKLIDSLTEDSALFLPFMELNSYIMKMILTEEDKKLIKSSKIQRIEISPESEENKKNLIKKVNNEQIITQNAYTISMLSVDTIKRHLKQTMKPYALIFEKDADLDFNASVYKDNNIICFNEDKIFKEIYSHYLYNKSYRKKRCKDFAFILNMHFLHENSCHNKEKIFNNKIESPILFTDKDLITSVILLSEKENFGEAGCFVESFIGDRETILGLVNCQNKFGNLLDIKYFNKINFNDLIQNYNSNKSTKENNIDNQEKNNKDSSSFNKSNYNLKPTKKTILRDNLGFTVKDYKLMDKARKKIVFID
jgi:hypothetical protein